jgi:alanine racemase
MTRPVLARIDLQALQHNFSLARQAAAGSSLMAVIKANAYGHGAVPVARALPQADAFALASVEEAVQLRDAGIAVPLVLLEGMFAADEQKAVIEYDLQVVVHCQEQVDWLERNPATGPLHLWLKVDTGMHRLGISPPNYPEVHRRLSALIAARGGSLRLMSHLACADEPQHPANDSQLAVFRELDAGTLERSLANSAALLSRPDMRFDWVRPGIMLYGASPFDPAADRPTGLRPVMNLESQLIAVYVRNKGDSIGYGQSWSCPRDMPVGVAAAGYGDGYPRHAPAGTPVLVNGRVAPLVGRVSMDMICVDLGGQPGARVGDPVRLWGAGLPVEAVAARADTISYELLCNVSPRVPREYVNGQV